MFDNELYFKKNDDGHSGNDDINMQSGTKGWTQTFLTQIGLIENRALQRKYYQYCFLQDYIPLFPGNDWFKLSGIFQLVHLGKFWKNSRKNSNNCVDMNPKTSQCVSEPTGNEKRSSWGILLKFYQCVIRYLEDNIWLFHFYHFEIGLSVKNWFWLSQWKPSVLELLLLFRNGLSSVGTTVRSIV